MASVTRTPGSFVGPITALNIVHIRPRNADDAEPVSLLLSGTGPTLLVHTLSDQCLRYYSDILPNSRIHGVAKVRGGDIREHAGLVVVYGQKQVRILQVEVDTERKVDVRVVFAFREFRAWIYDVAYFPSLNKAWIGLGHNHAELWDLSENQCVDRVKCSNPCMLYSFSFYGDTLENLWGASGTVFNEVLLWPVVVDGVVQSGQVQHRLVGHNGVIFRVRWYDGGKGVASVSDDRTVRLWARGSDGSFMSVRTVYGHAARVWDCQVGEKLIVTASEDSTSRVFDRFSGKELAYFGGHKGKNVWRVIADWENRIVVTGGADASIKVWSLDRALAKANMTVLSKDYEMPVPAGPTDGGRVREEAIRRVLHVNRPDEVFVSTNRGFVYLMNNGVWTVLFHSEGTTFDTFACYDAPSGEDERRLWLVLPEFSGRLIVVLVGLEKNEWRTRLLCDFDAHSARVMEIFRVEECARSTLRFISASTNGELKWWQLSASEDHAGLEASLVAEFRSYEDQPRIKEASKRINSVALSPSKDYILVGGGEGSVFVYRLGNIATEGTCPGLVMKPLSVSKYRTKKDGRIVAILFRGPSQVVAVLRMGVVLEMKVAVDSDVGVSSGQETTPTLERLVEYDISHQLPTVIDAVLAEGDLVCKGFFAEKFAVWNITKALMEIEFACASWKRPSSYLSYDVGCVFVSAKGLVVSSSAVNAGAGNDTVDERVGRAQLNAAFHGKESNSIRIFPLQKSRGHVIVTGSEDKTILVSSINDPSVGVPGHPRFRICAKLEGHSSIVRGLATIPERGWVFSCGGSEGLFCWELREQDDGREVMAVKKALIGNSSVRVAGQSKLPSLNRAEVFARLMCVCAWPIGDNEESWPAGARPSAVVACGSSDTSAKIYLYYDGPQLFVPLCSLKFHQGPVLCIDTVVVNERRLVVTGGTDGRVAVWDLSGLSQMSGVPGNLPLNPPRLRHVESDLQPIESCTVHSSGVNALQILVCSWCGDDEFVVASGGDDQSAALTIVKCQGASTMLVHVFANAHSSSLKSVRVVAKGDLVFTTSLDQRLNVWKAERVHGLPRLAFLGADFIDVSDVAAMDVFEERDGSINVTVLGQGMQSLRFESRKL